MRHLLEPHIVIAEGHDDLNTDRKLFDVLSNIVYWHIKTCKRFGFDDSEAMIDFWKGATFNATGEDGLLESLWWITDRVEEIHTPRLRKSTQFTWDNGSFVVAPVVLENVEHFHDVSHVDDIHDAFEFPVDGHFVYAINDCDSDDFDKSIICFEWQSREANWELIWGMDFKAIELPDAAMEVH